MADKGFQMPPSERREPKQFEPPPWERDAFEELQRRRQEAVAAEEEHGPSAGEGESARPGEQHEVETQRAPDENPRDEEGVAERQVAPPSSDVVAQAATGAEAPNDSMVEAMLLQLAAEEPREDRAISAVQLWVAIALYGLAVPLIIWGMAALVGAQQTGTTGMVSGFVLLVFGAGSVAGAIYLTVKSLQKRGVL